MPPDESARVAPPLEGTEEAAAELPVSDLVEPRTVLLGVIAAEVLGPPGGRKRSRKFSRPGLRNRL
jgi:hypothetical protein